MISLVSAQGENYRAAAEAKKAAEEKKEAANK